MAALLNLSSVQTFLAKKAAGVLAEKLKTKVEIKHLSIDFLSHAVIEGLYIQDHAQDTLLYAGRVEVRLTDWFFLKKGAVVLHYIGLHDAYAHLYRTPASEVWNYQFVIDAFDSGPKTEKKKKEADLQLDLKKIDLGNVRFHMDDAWAGSDLDFDVGSLALNADNIDMKKKILDINSIELVRTFIVMNDYTGGRPPNPHKKPAPAIDNTPFNTGNWAVHLGKLSLDDCMYKLTSSETVAPPDLFDATHLYVRDIKILAKDINIKGDTLRGDLKHLEAKERCGLAIKEFKAKVTVSPNASICDQMLLQTNNSKLQHYYAMRYKRFPDFKDYITNVVMEGHLANSTVDSKDIAYFAPVLKQYPTMLKIAGDVKGSVSALKATNLFLTDGSSIVKGNISMTGLPDIYKTLIDYTDGDIMTTGAGIIKYAPSLKNNPNIAIDKLSYLYYKGNFKGYIENFAANGVLSSNFGTIRSDIKLDMPKLNADNAAYSGTISTDNFNLGALLRQPDLGSVSMNSTIKGSAFDPSRAQVELKANIGKISYNNYEYKNVSAEGILEKKKFNGKLLIDDPNLALAFNGSIDFSQDVASINATANLLKSDLKALHFTKDSIVASADFDLDCKGTNIDNFTGYAKLFNIDLRRNSHRLDVDSIYINSSQVDGKKMLTVQSNDVEASIEGNYTLSGLPYSIQYYVAGYLPNYIKQPTKAAPEQDLSFSIRTKNIDSLLGVLAPNVKGFDTATVSGSLNTMKQTLTLNAEVPFGMISNVRLHDIDIKGTGDFKKLTLDGSVSNILVGDSMLNVSMNVKAALGSDSLQFKIATSSPDAYGTATLNGEAYARGDSLYMTMLPSEFYLNQGRWEIPGGCRVAIADKYLYIKGLTLQSGLQKLTVNTQNETTLQTVLINTENLDIAQLGALAGLSSYQPDGRISGNIKIDNLYRNMLVNAQVKATDVKLAADTIGNINITGTYDAGKHVIYFDQQTGIYRGGSSLNVYGKISSDSTSTQRLDGNITFNNAPLVWLSPFVTGYISGLKGSLNGNITIGGTGVEPDIDGKVNLSNASTHIDFLGTTYLIPKADININNEKIDLGTIALFDTHDNEASLTGSISHQRFKKMRLNFRLKSSEFEMLNLKDYENPIFYGNLIANVERLYVTGPVNDIKMELTATPIKKSHLYLPMSNSTGVGTYSYVTFKKYGEQQTEYKKVDKNKFTLNLTANMTPESEVTLLIDPSTGDAINAKGTGQIKLEIPLGSDIHMYGNYEVAEGDYTFTFRQLFFKRKFILNPGSIIQFTGPVNRTNLNVNANYTVNARLYDLLTANEISSIPNRELDDAKSAQDVNVILHMNGSLADPKLTFNIELPDRRSIGTYAYTKLEAINRSDRELFDQVASLLLVGSFIPPEGLFGGNSAMSGAINNISEIISTTASSQLSNIVKKLIGDPSLSIDLKYKNYNLSDPSVNSEVNRNEVSLGVKKNLLNDRLIVQVGGAYDWGRPGATNNSTTNFNLAGDFRVQYLLTENGNLRANLFHTSNYDVLLDRNVDRSGVGLSWRRTFDSLSDLFKSKKNKTELPQLDTSKADNREGSW